MTEDLAKYILCFSAAAIMCIGEGLILLAVLYGGLAIRAVWSKLGMPHIEENN
jgi:hypothetical protein